MDALDCIFSRRSTRNYLSRPVEEELLSRVVEAGRCAPSGGNSQTTHLLVIRDRAILAKLQELVQERFARMEETPGMYASIASSIRRSREGHYVFHYNAPVLIVAANRKGYGNAMADCACALENMMLCAHALELGSCWINQLHWLEEDEAVRSYLLSLGLGENECVCGALALGYPDAAVRTPLPRTGNPVTWLT